MVNNNCCYRYLRPPIMRISVISLILLLASNTVDSFLPLNNDRRRPNSSFLADIAAWRDTLFDFPGTDRRPLGTESNAPPKPICVLPFPFTEVLLQGETKQLRLYEDRFIQLFEQCMKEQHGVVAMGLLAESGIVQTVPLAEIENYNRMEGFGIFVTIRVVSRAKLIDITQQEPFIEGVCVEMADTLPPNLELPSLVASNIENYMLLLSSMEHKLEAADATNETAEDREMQLRIKRAELEDTFYDDEDEDDDDDQEEIIDRRRRFTRAYEVALSTDTQGYQLREAADRSPQELTALSWAAFCSGILNEEDAAYRIQALDADNLFDRLKLAASMLREKKAKLKTKLEKAGLQADDDSSLDEDL